MACICRTWGKSMDNSSTTVSNYDFTNSLENPQFFATPLAAGTFGLQRRADLCR